MISVILSRSSPAFAGAFVYKVLDDARKHDALEAASTQFCQTVADNPDMVSQPTFGFPAPAASIPDTLTAIQEYVDRWDALAEVSPSRIRTDVTRVADAARGILDTITTTRLVNNDENVAVMSNVASSDQHRRMGATSTAADRDTPGIRHNLAGARAPRNVITRHPKGAERALASSGLKRDKPQPNQDLPTAMRCSEIQVRMGSPRGIGSSDPQACRTTFVGRRPRPRGRSSSCPEQHPRNRVLQTRPILENSTACTMSNAK